MRSTIWFLPLCLLSLNVVACGGSVYESAEDGGGGPSSGGSRQGSGGAGTGTGGAGTGGGECCLADAICNAGDIQIESESGCPAGATCYSNSICCSTVWCVKQSPVNCDAFPVCEQNEFEVGVCPEGATCNERTLCGSTILCEVKACDPALEPERKYAATSPEQCALIDFDCGSDTSYFSNACGCGCETCPEYIDCMPKSCNPDEGCTGTDPRCSTDWCPNTLRAY